MVVIIVCLTLSLRLDDKKAVNSGTTGQLLLKHAIYKKYSQEEVRVLRDKYSRSRLVDVELLKSLAADP